VARHHDEGRREATVGERDPGQARGRHRARHTGDDLERNPCGGERQAFLASATEHEGVASLEAHDVLAAPGRADEDACDRLLAHRHPTGALAHAEALGVWGGEREDFRRHERVVEDEVGVRQDLGRPAREQAGVAGSGSDQPHAARHAETPREA
jgi:hypothetical protein